MTTPHLPTLFDDPPLSVARRERDRALTRIRERAATINPAFLESARTFVLRYLAEHGPTSGEDLTIACKRAEIVPSDDRWFGAVYQPLAKAGQIVKVGEVKRKRGHGTSGGTVWGLAR